MDSAKVICPFCSCPVQIKKFGNGWVGLCCREIIYNSDQLPRTKLPEDLKTASNISSQWLFLDSPRNTNNNIHLEISETNLNSGDRRAAMAAQ